MRRPCRPNRIHRNRHACATNISANHSDGQSSHNSSDNVGQRRRFGCRVCVRCVVKHKFDGHIKWAWVSHLFPSSSFSRPLPLPLMPFCICYSRCCHMLPGPSVFHYTSDITNAYAMRSVIPCAQAVLCDFFRFSSSFASTLDIINTNSYFCLSMFRIKLPAVEINLVIDTWYVKTETVRSDHRPDATNARNKMYNRNGVRWQ